MHDTAHSTGKLFFDVYWKPTFHDVLDVGSQDVNGSLREFQPHGSNWVGVDMEDGNGVDIVIDDPHKLPFDDNSFDIIVTSSAMEHDDFFWLTFAEEIRVLRPGGYLYINVPTNGYFHTYPLDCWRFYPDAGIALERWGQRLGHDARLVESFIPLRIGDIWNDFVLVITKGEPEKRDHYLADRHPGAYNIRIGRNDIRNPAKLSEDMLLHQELRDRIRVHEAELALRGEIIDNTRRTVAEELAARDQLLANERHAFEEELAARHALLSRERAVFERECAAMADDFALKLAALAERSVKADDAARELAALVERSESERASLAASFAQEQSDRERQRSDWERQRLDWDRERDDLSQALGRERWQVNAMRTSTSWRVTRPLRMSGTLLRGCARVALRTVVVPARCVVNSPVGRLLRLKRLIQWQLERHPGFARRVAPLVNRPTPPIAVVQQAIEQAKSEPTPDLGAFADTIAFPETEAPKASVLIPVYGQVKMTLECLDALARSVDASFPYEVILVDDASPDEDTALFERVRNLRYIRNPENLGFLRTCNTGAKHARAPYLVLLNNDTLPLVGWLERLIETFQTRPDAGLVGAKLLYPDGRLQEAGGLIWSDGSGWNYGHSDDPTLPQYNFLRSVDYCSGAAIAVPMALWNELGGFDETFAPAYFEDSDLAFQIRAHGRAVLYQPLSAVVHLEGASNGTDLTKGIKRHQVINRERFLAKWSEELAKRPTPPDGPDHFDINKHLGRHVLFLDATTPTPDRDAGSVDAYNFMRSLIEAGFHVSFFPWTNGAHIPRYTEALQTVGVQPLYGPAVPLGGLDIWLRKHGASLDAVVITRVTVARECMHLFREFAPQARVVFNTTDVHFIRETRQAELSGDPEEMAAALRTRDIELGLARTADATIVVSDYEAKVFKELLPAIKLYHIPISREIPGRTLEFVDRKNIVFIGGFQHPPNLDGVKFFLSEIWPRVRAALPDVEFVIVGSNTPKDLLEDAGEGVVVRGYVEDLGDVFNDCRLSVAPLRYGAGQKGKVVTALSYGVPTVATKIAVEGMALTPGTDVLVADDPAEFADQIIALYNDADRWLAVSDNGLERVRQEFGYDVVKKQVVALVEDALTLPRRF